jgi:predicted nuclease with RNAse H fold/dephospho-CoA kinase
MDFAAPAEQSALPFTDLIPTHPNGSTVRKTARQSRTARRSIDPRILTALNDARGVLFLDVETTGLSRHYDELTIVGWLSDGIYRIHVAGDDPEPFLSSLRAASALVTFNGTLFDLAFLAKSFPELSLPKVHADLRFLARRVGLTGGQKAIERKLGIQVRRDVEELDGAQAVLLWHRYLRGDVGSLRRLIDYNRADVVAMRHILDEVLERLVSSPDLWFAASRFSQHPYSVSGWALPASELPSASRLDKPKNTYQSLFAGTSAEHATIVGIDLTGSEARPSGWCVLHGAVAETEMVATDDEMIARIIAISPSLVSIDSPLSLPLGRIRVEDDDPGRLEFGIMRRCELELKRRGINVYPCLLPSMQGLTRRGMRLAGQLRRLGIPVIESYPGAAQDIMGIPRKGAGEAFLKAGLQEFGVSGDFLTGSVRHDELDAITSALVGSFFLAEKHEALTGPSEDALIIPDLKAAPGPVVVGISGRICAGKTTAARFLERQGFAYTRFSLVVDDEIKKLGERPNRELRQRIGLEINRTKGQKWLCEQTLVRVGSQPLIVVDGLRFLEDRAFFFERFGSRFLHLHIVARHELREKRYRKGDGPSLADADAMPVEGEIDLLGARAAVLLNNSSTIDDLSNAVASAVEGFMRKVGEECQFRLS